MMKEKRILLLGAYSMEVVECWRCSAKKCIKRRKISRGNCLCGRKDAV